MTGSEITLALFTICNGLRILAYIPQIVRAARDRSGAEAISFSMWSLFLVANASAVAYALINKNDWAMAALFIGNGCGCATILGIAIWKRSSYRAIGDWSTADPRHSALRDAALAAILGRTRQTQAPTEMAVTSSRELDGPWT